MGGSWVLNFPLRSSLTNVVLKYAISQPVNPTNAELPNGTWLLEIWIMCPKLKFWKSHLYEYWNGKKFLPLFCKWAYDSFIYKDIRIGLPKEILLPLKIINSKILTRYRVRWIFNYLICNVVYFYITRILIRVEILCKIYLYLQSFEINSTL